jgi:serine/threonine-protein kinase HipA
MSQKSVEIYFKNIRCGTLIKHGDDSFEFQYDQNYIDSSGASISLSLPISQKVFKSSNLFSFFEGLIPEGWLLNLAQKELRLNANKDKFELLVALCSESIGAVHIGQPQKIKKTSFTESDYQSPKFNFKKCLICYEEFQTGDNNGVYHKKCMKNIFSDEIIPCVELDNSLIENLAKITLHTHKTITGVQKKISLDLHEEDPNGKGSRLTLTDLWGKFILKPRGNAPHYPENEHLCTKLAEILGIETERSALIPMKAGELAFIARRFDRGQNNEEFHQEDFCQILDKTSHQKYTGSIEQIAKVLKNNSTSPGNDIFRLFQLVIFNFIIGNVDLHNKNLSICFEDNKGKRIFLSPAYDLLSTDLFIDDDEQSALAINGKKNKLEIKDFISMANTIGVSQKVFENIIQEIYSVLPAWLELIDSSFLSQDDKLRFKNLILDRLEFFHFDKNK